jgi:chaperonin GroES
MNLKPLSDRLIVKPADNEEKTASGIIVPDTAKEKPMQGEVVAVGPGKLDDSGKRIIMEVKVGDKVMYGKYSGTEFQLDRVDYLIMNESDILAIFN